MEIRILKFWAPNPNNHHKILEILIFFLNVFFFILISKCTLTVSARSRYLLFTAYVSINIIKILHHEYRLFDLRYRIDPGLNVREKAKQLVLLLMDDEKLRNERIRAFKAKERFAQSATAFGSDTTSVIEKKKQKILS